jgi:hypothetical protein
VLSALAFNQKGVTGVEINEGIIDLVNNRFGDFTGQLDRDPRVVIAIGAGISAAFWTGTLCYAVALVALRWQTRPAVASERRRTTSDDRDKKGVSRLVRL